MISGRSVSEVQALLRIRPSTSSKATTVDFRGLPQELRQLCYEHLDTTAATILTLGKALEGYNGYEDVTEAFVEWTSKLLAIKSPSRTFLHQLAPGAEIMMYRPTANRLCKRVGRRSRANGDEIYDGSRWRPTQHMIGILDSFPIGKIGVDDKFCMLYRGSANPEYLILCKRTGLEAYSQKWILFWPISSLVVMPFGVVPNLNGAVKIFRSIKPEVDTLLCEDKNEDTSAGTVATKDIMDVLQAIKNQQWSGYPPEVCLKQSLELISAILTWHDHPRARYYCGQRLETPLSAADRETLVQSESTFNAEGVATVGSAELQLPNVDVTFGLELLVARCGGISLIYATMETYLQQWTTSL